VHLTDLRYFNAGYCVQNEYFTGTGTLRWRRFSAVFVAFEHPVHGQCLIDTGYGPTFLQIAKRTFSGWLMRHLLFTPANQPVFQAGFLSSLGVQPEQVSHVFVSHYHADHIGGLDQFPTSKLVCRPEPLRVLQSLSPWKQLDNGFLPQLIPHDLSARLAPVEESRFSIVPHIDSAIPSCDYFGDGSVVLLDLPGHACGHTGYLLNTAQGRIGYVVDAFWDTRTFQQSRHLPVVSRRVQRDPFLYQQTQDRLRELQKQAGIPLLACHCPTTQSYVENPH
jgi:glyoxylase-like metal-dependent hydrolase (beta-lactamase superfamily II)